MKNLFLLTILSLLIFGNASAQTDSSNIISHQIINERNSQLNELDEKLLNNQEVISQLTVELSTIDDNSSKIEAIQKLQNATELRLKLLEETPKITTSLNGQLAFTELLSIQRDLQPAKLFLSSQSFFNDLGSIGNLNDYKAFQEWNTEYQKWHEKQEGGDQMVALLSNSLNLITDATNSVPLYGSIIQTASIGISSLASSLGKKDKVLSEKSPAMLELLMVTGQFENQKAIIDHEWNLINKELEQLQKENDILLKEQLKYYGLSMEDFQNNYMDQTLDSKRDIYKNMCRKKIQNKINILDADSQTNGKWKGDVETYMYKVQSLRLRFGQLTNRMLSLLNRYDDLIVVYSDPTKFPPEFTNKIISLKESLTDVRNNFYTSFKPEKYIEDSAVMYIGRK